MLDVSALILYMTNPLGRPQILQADRQTDRHADSQTGRRVNISDISLERPSPPTPPRKRAG